MKKLTFLFALVLSTAFGYSQTIVYHENFESPSLADSVVSSGNPGWHVGSFLHNSGLRSDSSRVAQNDSTYLTTTTFSTTGYSNVILQFSQICKIELYDHATIEVSNNNGITWSKLTTAQYMGTGSFTNNQFDASSYTDWLQNTPIVVPANSWWKTEQFDISAFAGNAASVKVRFKLKDGNGTGAGGNWGWVIDDIRVFTSVSELIPPVITYNTPIVQDTIYSSGPFNISATITDASGIQWAKIVYKLNGAAQYDTVSMINTSGNIYQGSIPSFPYNSKIWYHVIATDNSVAHNLGANPSSGDKWFYTKEGPTVVIIGTGSSNSGLLPAYGLYNYSWGAQLYKASEINMPGLIDSIGFYVGNSITSYVMNNQKVFIGHTSATTCGTAQPDTTNMTVAYSGNLTFIGPVWFKIKLQNTFYYNGTSNLMIYWVNKDGTWVSGYPSFNYTPTTTYLGTYMYNDTYTSIFPVSSGTQTYNRPNLRLAFKATHFHEDAGVTLINNPTGIILASTSLPVQVTLKNFGTDTLHSAKLNWKLDGITQTQYPWAGNLLPAVSSSPVTIATQTFTAGSHTIKAWSLLPNDSTDQNHANDTTVTSFYACNNILNGTYTLGGGGADFATFTDALISLENCGISGPVVFNVNAGTYNEQLNIPQISGTSSTNTITFQSASGLNTDVTLTYGSTSSTNNYTIELNGADHLRFKNMTIAATNATYGHVLGLLSAATDNQFTGNKITGPSTTSTSSDNALVYSIGSNLLNDSLNVYDNNTFLNGSYGIYDEGYSTSSLESGTSITNNSFTNQAEGGIYLYYENAPAIIGNTIITSTVNTGYTGIYTTYCYNNMKILKNKINIQNGGYGIELYYNTSTLARPALIANNFVYIATGYAYGIYAYYAIYQNIFYNSVNIASSNATGGMAMEVSYGSSPITITNNIFANSGAGYSFYSSVTTGITSDYNDLYRAGTNLGYWGGTNCTNITNWRTNSGQDAHSISVDPSFTSASDLHVSTLALNGAATPLPAVSDDIDGQPRNGTTPDIGADEFTPAPIDLAVTALVSPPSSGCYGTNMVVKYRIKNLGTDTLFCSQHNVVFNSSVTGPNPLTFPVVTLTTDTILSGASKVIKVSSTYDMTLSGVYTFKGNVNTSVDANHINDTLAPVAISNDVITSYPYVVDFSSAPSPTWTIQQLSGTGNWSILAGAMTNPALSPVFGTGMLYFSSYSLSSGTKSRAIIPTLNLTGVNNPQLEFWMSHDVGYSTYLQEGVTVRISTDGGLTWTNDTMFVPRYNAAFTTAGWLKATKSLNAYHSFTCVKIAFDALSQDGNNLSLDKVQILEPPTQEAALTAITNPVSGCGLGLEPVKIWIKNTGSMVINANLSASYKLSGGTPVTEPVPASILPGDSTLYTFTTLANVAAVTHDTTFSLKAWVTLTGDPIHTNDTANTSITSGLVPTNPVVTNVSIPYGTTATLHAVASDSVRWYTTPSGGLPVSSSSTFTTPVLYNTTVYYAEAISNGSSQNWTFDTGLNGWTDQTPCSYSLNWVWASDGGHGTIFASDPATTSSRLIVSPSIPVAGLNSMNLGFKHRYYSESCCDEGYVAYKLDNGSWTQFVPTTNAYNSTGHSIDYDPLNSCTSDTKNCFAGTGTYAVSSGAVNTTGAANMQIAFVFTSDGSLGYDGWYIDSVGVGNAGLNCPSQRIPDTVHVSGMPPYDAGVEVIYAPNTGIELTNAEPVTVRIKNFGTSAITGFPVSYKIGGSAPVTETVGATLNQNDTLDYTFTAAANLSAYGTYSIKSYTSLSGDVTYPNDTAYKSVTNNMLTFCTSAASYTNDDDISNVTFAGINNSSTTPYNGTYTDYTSVPAANVTPGVTYPISVSINFSSSYTYSGYCKVFIDYNHDGVFTEPGELAFGAPYTGIQTLTGSVTIPANATLGLNRMRVVAVESGTSTSVVPCGTYSWGETEDYLVRMFSPIPHDAGVTQIKTPAASEFGGNIVPVKVIVTNFGLDTIFNSSNMLVNYSVNGGTVVSTPWNNGTILPMASDSIILPSITVPYGNNSICAYTVLPGDSNTTNDQTCKAFYGNLPPDAGILRITQPATSTPMYLSSPLTVRIKNYSLYSLSSIPVGYRVNGGTPVHETYTGSILPGDSATYTFTTYYTSPGAAYSICAFTGYTNDANHNNDTLCKSVSVTAALIDVGITKIVLPAGVVTTIGTATTVEATIKNFGVNTMTTIPVKFIVNGGTPVTESWTGLLVSGDSVNYTFTNTYMPPALASYSLCVKTALSTDLVTTNDQVCNTYNAVVGIAEGENNGMSLEQNIPNPANDQTTIEYTVPDNGKAEFTVMNSIGQIIYREATNVGSGKHQVKLNIGSWSAGVYIYTLNFNGSKLYKRMTITK